MCKWTSLHRPSAKALPKWPETRRPGQWVCPKRHRKDPRATALEQYMYIYIVCMYIDNLYMCIYIYTEYSDIANMSDIATVSSHLNPS